MIHVINVYGPQGSGKTRMAEELKVKYDCCLVLDEGGKHWTVNAIRRKAEEEGKPVLVLSQSKMEQSNRLIIEYKEM